MFGLKIISKSEYYRLLDAYTQSRVVSEDTEVAERRLKDIDSLREQNGKLRQEINRLSQLNDVAGLKDYCVLRAESYPCDKCKMERKMDCKKLMFADSTICICHKDEKPKFINDFKSKKR
jgi:hypothetical protein